MKPKDKPHYVSNKQFSQAVMDYVIECNKAKEEGRDIPIVPDYIAECFLKISEGLSYKSNFVGYSYREEMVMDAVENNLKAIYNYNIDAATRTGNPNAFSYFTQISYYAFLRRIAKEKKQQDIKYKFIESSDYEEFMAFMEEHGGEVNQKAMTFVDELKYRIDEIKERDNAVKEYAKKNSKPKGVELFMGEDSYV